MKPLTPKQARFVEEYLIDLNGTRAAIRAGYKPGSADVRASQLLGLRKVRAAVDTAIAKRSARAEVKADDVLRELMRLAFSDMGEAFDNKGRMLPLSEMSPEMRRAIASVEVEQMFDGSGENRYHSGDLVKVKFWDKNTALTNLAKHLKLLTDKVEHTADSSFAEMLKEARARAAKPE